MGAPGSKGQQVIVLGNAHMSEAAVKGQEARDLGPSHVCEPNPDGSLCTYVSECAWLRRWREGRVKA